MIKHSKLTQTIVNLRPGCQISICDDRSDRITVYDDTVLPSEAEIQVELDKIDAEIEATKYQRDRKEEYPTIEECIHAILDGELDALQVKRQAVKAKYPKGGN